ncbi:hypothetical protein C0J52_33744 [Blattella germanica]|nr:hypothetical protein C0J52_33744 [Blattella germanica]
MLSGLILVVFLICYCCHRNMSKGSPGRGSQYWQEESEVPLEIFTVDGQPPAPSPPPAYETVIAAIPIKKEEEAAIPVLQKQEEDEDDSGLPSYEAALRLEAQGYV